MSPIKLALSRYCFIKGAKKQKSIKFPEFRQFDKRGRKISNGR